MKGDRGKAINWLLGYVETNKWIDAVKQNPDLEEEILILAEEQSKIYSTNLLEELKEELGIAVFE